jgi:hypothetical protein
MTFSERCAEIDAEVRAAVLGSKTNLTPHPDLVAAMHAQQPMLCPKCEYPEDGTCTHYATCSKLTAPEGFVVEVEATFDELEARCPGCGVEPLVMHQPGCPVALESEEPAAAIDDDSPRRQAIDQNGNDGAVYEDPWYGAPEWAKYKAQDENGKWYWYSGEVYASGSQWLGRGDDYRLDEAGSGEPNPNWRDTLIERP